VFQGKLSPCKVPTVKIKLLVVE